MKYLTFTAALLAASLGFAQAPIEGFYGSVFGGFTWLFNDLSILRQEFLWDGAEHHWGYNGGVRVGYQSNPLRYELEYTYISARLSGFQINQLPQFHISGGSVANVAMVNVYYDFPDIVPAISPFIGVGIGYAHIDSSFSGFGQLGNVHLDATNTTFAYQATGGFTYNCRENFALNIAYRFTATPKLNIPGTNYQANLGTVGVIYRFDGNNYH